ncbi:MAG: FkbM family methyltransferase [Betaproteobacteria bacterium]|nr:FkbM family methyltransferase [Betaproteobacteria bacterium]
MLPRISKIESHDADYLLFSTGDFISNTLFRTGRWEEHLLAISRFMISGVERPLILDIGANLGAYSIPLAKNIQDIGGEVIGFEPQRIVYYQFCGNIILNRLENCQAVYAALGEEAGYIDIPEVDYEANNNVGGFSLDKRYRELQGVDGSMRKATKKVPLIKLDNFEVDRRPALIKIDVEGFELSVIRGGRRFLENHDYPPLLFEAWNYDWFREGKKQLFSYIADLGYMITNFGTTDYVAQHPKSSREISFEVDGAGVINMSRIR